MLHVLTIMAVLCAPQRADSFAQGLETAQATGQPLIVFAHGSDWCPHGEKMKADVWDLERRVSDVVFVDVDVLESPNEANTQRNAGFVIKSVKTYPSIVAFAPDGTRIGLRAGASLPKQSADATQVLRAFVEIAKERVALQTSANAANDAGNATAEIAAMHAMLKQDLAVPAGLIERLTAVDPEDASGVRRRAAFEPFHQFVAKATKDGKEGRGQEAIGRLQGMLDAGVYTPEQQAWIHNAMGSVYRYWDGHNAQAQSHFRQAAVVAPNAVPGQAGRQLALELYGDPTLESGWSRRHTTAAQTTWRIEDLPSPLKRGTWHITFDWTRGRHGIDIAQVQLLDGVLKVANDTHAGFAGTAPKNNVYVLEVPWHVGEPTLLVKVKGSGGTNSQGRISCNRVSPSTK
jgi:hypothetical protein